MSSERTWKVALLVAVAAVTATVATPAGDGKAGRREVYAAHFPKGPGQELAERYCIICHAVPLVAQQAKDSTAWEKTLGQMEKWGIHPTPAEHDTLRRYLVAHFGPRTH